jgi:Zn-finger nucleic acid-binding protein
MQAQTLNCPMCGAATSSDSPKCLYCGAQLATVSCPSCFGMIFAGSRHCPHCGAKASRAAAADLPLRQCPRCHLEMVSVAVGETALRECERCAGLWVEASSFEQICADREQQSAVLGTAFPTASGKITDTASQIRYIPCPECGQLMNRLNFARCSGVIVDVCKAHGTWFDSDELRRIVEFIRGGGLETARAKEKEEIEDQRRRLREEQLAADRRDSRAAMGGPSYDERRGALAAASDLLKLFGD